MRDKPFRDLQAQLLHGGVQLRHVSRIVAELQDHFCDLEEEILQGGATAEQASAQAAREMGDLQEIAAQWLAIPELKSFLYRWPWMTVVLRPLIMVSHAFVVPVLVAAERGSLIARWSLSGCLAAVFTGTLLFLLQWLYAGSPG